MILAISLWRKWLTTGSGVGRWVSVEKIVAGLKGKIEGWK